MRRTRQTPHGSSLYGYSHAFRNNSVHRDKRVFLASALLCTSLILVLAVTMKSRDVIAGQDYTVEAFSGDDVDLSSVTLYAPRRTIRKGDRLLPNDFKRVYWPKSKVPEAAIQELYEIDGKFALVDLNEEMPVLRTELSKERYREQLEITPGHRAVTISIDPETSNGYHVIPGTIVDVALVYHEGRAVKTEIVVEQARVISLGGYMQQDERASGRPRMNHKTVTLDVAPQDALKIITAKGMGKLTLMLRNPTDLEPMTTREMDENKVIRNKKKIEARKPDICGGFEANGKSFVVECDGSHYESVPIPSLP